jgi:putative nucleotidyltransferase with HDIG domain
LSWWLYHLLLVLALAMAINGLLQQYSRGESFAAVVSGLFSTDPIERLEAGISPSVRALVAATEARDAYTAGHSQRVALAAVEVGSRMGLSPEELRALAQGSILHDVGKLEIQNSLLNKSGALSKQERVQIERHVIKGFEMCKRLGFMQEELSIIRSHHEHYNGNGYPDGLAGENIPKLARILALVDVFDALTSDRSYRQSWTTEKAIDYIMKNRGAQFDPDCVDAWLDIFGREDKTTGEAE